MSTLKNNFIYRLLIPALLILFNINISAQDTCSYQIDLGPDKHLQTIPVSDLDAGIYFLEARLGKYFARKKFIIHMD